MSKTNDVILTCPRRVFSGHDGFIPWTDSLFMLESCATFAKWMARPAAEVSDEWVQPIPCALIRDSSGRFLVLTRVKDGRIDLRGRISLVVGGHVSESQIGSASILTVLTDALRREMAEEVGVKELVSEPKPLGIVIDSTSVMASRHIAVVFEAQVNGKLSSRAPEEFSTRSKFGGRFFSVAELSRFRQRFDPWSLLIFEHYICPSQSAKTGRQMGLSIP